MRRLKLRYENPLFPFADDGACLFYRLAFGDSAIGLFSYLCDCEYGA